MKRWVLIFLIIVILLITVVYAGLDAKSGKLIGVGSFPPSNISSPGSIGTITWDSNWIYVAIANNSWKRAALSTWAITDVLLLNDGSSKLLLNDGSSYLLIR